MSVYKLKKDLAKYARKMAQEGLTIGASGNVSARCGRKFYIKAAGKSFENLKERDFVCLDIDSPDIKGLKTKPSCEYKLHAACYSSRPDIKAIFHIHPFCATIAFSKGVCSKPVTMEFAAYIAAAITSVEFIPPGSHRLAQALKAACSDNDCIIMKKHGIIALGKTMHDAYVKNLIIEREAKAQIIGKLLQIKGAGFSRREMAMLVDAV